MYYSKRQITFKHTSGSLRMFSPSQFASVKLNYLGLVEAKLGYTKLMETPLTVIIRYPQDITKSLD